MMKIEQEKARTILKALIYQDIIDEYNKECAGEEISHDRPLVKEFTKICGLSDDTLDDLYEELHNNIDEFENNTFWRDFVEKIAVVKREEEAEKKDVKFSQEEAFTKLCEFEEDINKNLENVDLIDLWKYIAKYFN